MGLWEKFQIFGFEDHLCPFPLTKNLHRAHPSSGWPADPGEGQKTGMLRGKQAPRSISNLGEDVSKRGEGADPLFYVYTSGTTGLPKAAVISNIRFCYMAYGVELFFKLKPEDVNYISLPLYHTAGGILGAGQAVLKGTTLALRAKFSASQFWTDCVKYNCTVSFKDASSNKKFFFAISQRTLLFTHSQKR
ncbi:long-chain fatty acid transport protein [Plakobranchus ocellatus]|uniref:Long-chain-fatty-acid--CoA ligase n=1 Tax=Plakobranchus ocellatus TaxID=259542 RepID=A0AAV4DYR2_9GAST|nr:long-chain fatty acid transport protein [Plakobranchus ocellatus]